MLGPNSFRFLNQAHYLKWPGDWNDTSKEKLLLYNLHYFDDLNSTDWDERRLIHQDLIKRWVLDNPPGLGVGWDPYPISLRVVNWIKWALNENILSAEELKSLALQVRFLRQRLEYHLLGNHLIANAKALVYAGLFFQGIEAEEWLNCGLKILEAEVEEQILSDGGDFERSPMYHSIILEDLLDLKNIFRTYGYDTLFEWEEPCIRMRAWLKAMTHPDGEIALFNDAAFGIGPSYRDLDAYFARLGLPCKESSSRPLTYFPATGYVRCDVKGALLLLDVAPIGPDYIPGHAHADTLNFEFSLFGSRVVVDSGTSTYEKNAERQRQRGTAAHNTVTINEEDSSEVWGGFRVARRARPFGLKIAESEGEIRVTCAHDGYRRLSGKPVHHREWILSHNNLTIRDQISGTFRTAVGRFYLHPEICLEINSSANQGQFLLAKGEKITWEIKGGEVRVVDTIWCPSFGVCYPNKCLEVVFQGSESSAQFSW